MPSSIFQRARIPNLHALKPEEPANIESTDVEGMRCWGSNFKPGTSPWRVQTGRGNLVENRGLCGEQRRMNKISPRNYWSLGVIKFEVGN